MNKESWAQALVDQLPRLRRFARGLVQNRDHADDLVQDCIERAWSRSHLWQPGSNLRSWLFTMLHHLYINHLRRNRIRPVLYPIEGVDEPATHDEPTLLRDLEKCLAKLSPEQREVIVLAGLEQLSYQEMAEILDIPVGTVMSRLSRARERLRELMSHHPKPFMVRVK